MEEEKKIKVLDHGFVELVNYMGSDQDVDNAARLSYGKGTRKVSERKNLINYLMRHKHTSPSEMVEFVFHCKMPIFVARQWVRHRTASLNEYSARYSVLDKEFYIPKPEILAAQSNTNKQGREEESLDSTLASLYSEEIAEHSEKAYTLYQYLLNEPEWEGHSPHRKGIARELARMVLPLNFYTQWIWKIDMHNLFHFLKLRMDPHAQYEIRVYAEAIYQLIKPIVPESIEAFEKYSLNAVSFSGPEMEIVSKMLDLIEDIPTFVSKLALAKGLSKREQEELINKLTS